jgi:DnaK suppressor protein
MLETTRIRRQLERERDRVLLESGLLEEEAADWDGDIDMNGDIVDVGTAVAERTRTEVLANNARSLVAQIDTALARMEAGTYGRCDACGGPIEPERLEALPYATLCLEDKE